MSMSQSRKQLMPNQVARPNVTMRGTHERTTGTSLYHRLYLFTALTFVIINNPPLVDDYYIILSYSAALMGYLP